MDIDEAMSAEIRPLGVDIQRLFEGKQAAVCVATMAELICMQTVKVSRNHADAQEKLDAVHEMMGDALELHARKKWGMRH
jgi:hypothetical protein